MKETDPHKHTQLGIARADGVAVEAWFDAHGTLWLRAKDGELVGVPKDRLQKLKKLLRRGANQ